MARLIITMCTYDLETNHAEMAPELTELAKNVQSLVSDDVEVQWICVAVPDDVFKPEILDKIL